MCQKGCVDETPKIPVEKKRARCMGICHVLGGRGVKIKRTVLRVDGSGELQL